MTPERAIRVLVAKATSLSSRHIARRVDAPSSRRWIQLGQRAADLKTWLFCADHGGTVANGYGYVAQTEAVVAVASPSGIVVLWYSALPANKATRRGAAEQCLTGAGARWDGRCGTERSALADQAMRAAHEALVPPTDVELVARDAELEGNHTLASLIRSSATEEVSL